MIRRTIAVLGMALLCNHQASAQESKPKANEAPTGATTPGSAGGTTTQPGGKKAAPFGGGGFGDSPGMLSNPIAMFDYLARGRDFFHVTETLSLRGPLEQFLKERGVTNGQVTRALFTQFSDEMKTKMPRGAAAGDFGGGPTKEKDLKAMTLEELLTKALKDNPDIRVAETKTRDAEAELSRVRQQVAQKLTQLYEELKAKREFATEAQRQFEIALSLKNAGPRDIADAKLTLFHAKFELIKLEADLPYLIGKQPTSMSGPRDGGTGFGPMMPMGSGGSPTMGSMSGMSMGGPGGDLGGPKNLSVTLAEKVRTALEALIKGEFRDSRPSEIIEWLTRPFKGINIHVTAKIPDNLKVTIKLTEPIPTGAALQWLEDELGLVCILRDYGIVIAERDRIPPGATPLLDYWKKSKGAESKPK